MPPTADTTIELPDGRRLAYTAWGDPDGKPVFYFHGIPHSRLWCPDESATLAADVRLIAPDRPGIGRSDIKEARSFGQWPSDVVALADALGIERFAVVGWSSGGPYAAVCAALIPARLTGVGIVNSRQLAQFNVVERPEAYEELSASDRAEFDAAQKDPRAAAELVSAIHAESMTEMRDNPQNLYDFLKTEGDRWFFDNTERMVSFDAARRECFRHGMVGYRWELMDVWMPWGFRLTDISVPVHIWHGTQDPLVKQVNIDFIASKVPNCEVVVWPDCGHLGIAKHWDEILETVTSESA